MCMSYAEYLAAEEEEAANAAWEENKRTQLERMRKMGKPRVVVVAPEEAKVEAEPVYA